MLQAASFIPLLLRYSVAFITLCYIHYTTFHYISVPFISAPFSNAKQQPFFIPFHKPFFVFVSWYLSLLGCFVCSVLSPKYYIRLGYLAKSTSHFKPLAFVHFIQSGTCFKLLLLLLVCFLFYCSCLPQPMLQEAV